LPLKWARLREKLAKPRFLLRRNEHNKNGAPDRFQRSCFFGTA
jgi:hypothetical protein